MKAEVDWRKDMARTMWFLSDLQRKKRGCMLTAEERLAVQESLKDNVARLCRMATQKTAGQRGMPNDLDTLNGGFERVVMSIAIAATDLCLDGAFGPMPDRIEGDACD